MIVPFDTAFDQLLDLLAEAKLTPTFSINCRSGLVGGRERCICWRCKRLRGEEPNEELAEAAAAGTDAGDLRRRALGGWP